LNTENREPNILYYGDNLDILRRYIDDESVLAAVDRLHDHYKQILKKHPPDNPGVFTKS
jgi:hypothetical protein